jgi:hypothetical protein
LIREVKKVINFFNVLNVLKVRRDKSEKGRYKMNTGGYSIGINNQLNKSKSNIVVHSSFEGKNWLIPWEEKEADPEKTPRFTLHPGNGNGNGNGSGAVAVSVNNGNVNVNGNGNGNGSSGDNYLLVGVVSQSEEEKLEPCVITAPADVEVTFISPGNVDVKVTVFRRGNETFLKVPEGPPTWQLKITLPQLSAEMLCRTPDNVTVGEDDPGVD